VPVLVGVFGEQGASRGAQSRTRRATRDGYGGSSNKGNAMGNAAGRVWWIMVVGQLALPVQANDAFAEVAGGSITLVPTAAVVMEDEDLLLSLNEVDVRYVFHNTSDVDVTHTIAFPMPDKRTLSGFYGHSPGAFHAFSVEVDGRLLPATRVIRAYRIPPDTRAEQGRGEDITDLLHTLGLSDDDIVAFADASVESIPDHRAKSRRKLSAVLPRLKKAGLIEDDLTFQHDGPKSKPQVEHVEHVANIVLATTWTWEATFPARARVSVRHRYRPHWGSYQHATFEPRFCPDPGLNAAMERRSAKRAVVPSFSALAYVLSSGALWHGPIRRFHLVVRKPTAESVLSTCFDGALTKINATDFEFTATDYTPRGDILIGVVR
jgi:hypothetical protein